MLLAVDLLVDLVEIDGRRIDVGGLRLAVGEHPIPLVLGEDDQGPDQQDAEDREPADVESSQSSHVPVSALRSPA